MEWLLLIPPVALVLYAIALVVPWCARVGYWYVLASFAAVHDSISEGAAQVARSFAETRERLRVERRFAVAAGTGGTIDHEAVEAARQMPVIRRLIDEELPKAVVRCIRIHRLSAAAVGARFIREIAHESECSGLRQRVVAIAASAEQLIEQYPCLVEDENLMANNIVLRSRVIPICSHCPYLDQRLESAPLLCPTGVIIRIDPSRVIRDGVQ